MNKFEYYNPVKIIFGPGEVSRVGAEVRKVGKKALIVSYKDAGPLLSVLDRVKSRLYDEGIDWVEFLEVTPNSILSAAENGTSLAKKEKVDLVLGIGGGSAMDLAKIVAAGVKYKGRIWDMMTTRHDEVSGIAPEASLPTVMVPTLPATSSEMNSGAVLTNSETTEKAYVFAEGLYPEVSILDPELTITLPLMEQKNLDTIFPEAS